LVGILELALQNELQSRTKTT